MSVKHSSTSAHEGVVEETVQAGPAPASPATAKGAIPGGLPEASGSWASSFNISCMNNYLVYGTVQTFKAKFQVQTWDGGKPSWFGKETGDGRTTQILLGQSEVGPAKQAPEPSRRER